MAGLPGRMAFRATAINANQFMRLRLNNRIQPHPDAFQTYFMTYYKDRYGDVFRQKTPNGKVQQWLYLGQPISHWAAVGFAWRLDGLEHRRRISADTARKMGVVI